MADLDDTTSDQHFCLRWNNFHTNITSQFEALRCNEDFTDVTIACEGQKLLAHKVVLSACSPYFKDLFKTNPCSHPIVFMRDVEARHIVALMEFMYVGEVNVSQAHLSSFLKTAESLKIRGLTDTSSDSDHMDEENSLSMKPQALRSFRSNILVNKTKPKNIQVMPPSSTANSSQDVPLDLPDLSTPNFSSQPAKKSKLETEFRLRKDDSMNVNPFAIQDSRPPLELLPKVELPDYISDEDNDEDTIPVNYYHGNNDGGEEDGIDISAQDSNFVTKDVVSELSTQGFRLRRRKTSDHWMPYSLHQYGQSSLSAPLSDMSYKVFDKREPERRNKLVCKIKLGEGIEICEEQLRSIKGTDYRKLTRGLATILFSPAELATCSVTGQRWSRAGNGERPVKPALDRSKVQAIISYVAARFPMVEISRIKQVLAYKCKENSTAFKMKAVRYYGHSDQHGS